MSRSCSRFLGFLFAVIFILAGIGAVIFYHLEFTLLRPEPYLEAIRDENFASRLTDIAAQELAASLETHPCGLTPELCARSGGPPSFLIRLSEDEWKDILDLLITSDWIVDQAEVVIGSVFQVIDGGDSDTRIAINIEPIKARMRGEAGAEVIEIVLASLPVCSQDQITQLGQVMLSGGNIDQLLICAPPPEVQNLVLPILDDMVGGLAGVLPDEVLFNLNDFGFGELRDEAHPLNQVRDILRQGFYLSAAIAAGTLLVVLLLTVRSLKDLLFWTGWPILSIGLILLSISLLMRGSSGLLLQVLLSSFEPMMLQSKTVDLLLEFFQAVVTSLFSGLTVQFAGLAMVGFVLLVFSRFFPDRKQAVKVDQRPNDLY